MKTVIIKYNSGNTMSVIFALRRLGIEPQVTDDPAEIKSADKVIFPGVGEASSAMSYLREHKMDDLIRNLTQPVLAICIGMQLLCKFSEEGATPCLGVFDLSVKRFVPPADKTNLLKIPHMGWNTISGMKSQLFRDVEEHSFVYFVHSYYVDTGQDTAAFSSHINPFSAALQKNNFFATQFHPEKSGTVGEKIIKNFIEL